MRVLQSRAVLAATVGDYYPQQQQQAFGRLMVQRASTDSAGLLRESTRSANLGRAGISAAWEIDFWGMFRRAVEAADSGLVASTYVNRRAAEAKRAIVQSNLRLQREGLRIATVRFHEGATSKRAPAQADPQLADTEAQIPPLIGQIEKTQNALAVLLGMPPAERRGMIGPGLRR